MKITYKFKPDTSDLLSWNELHVGDVFYHVFTHNVGIKTSINAYMLFSDKKYHTRSKLLQGSTSKTYYQIKSEFIFEI